MNLIAVVLAIGFVLQAILIILNKLTLHKANSVLMSFLIAILLLRIAFPPDWIINIHIDK